MDMRNDPQAGAHGGRAEPLATGSSPSVGFADLLAAEDQLLVERRRIASGNPADTRPRVGLALSGGGIRSATFCLGLVRGLASNGLLKRVDYLSTVSGGGFTGGMLGRLVSSIGIERAQNALGRTDSLVMWWLRRNGRYLTPSGSRDLGMALVTYLRAWIAVHIEFAFVALAVGILIVAPHLLQNEWGWFDPATWGAWGSAWWPLAILAWLATAPGTMLAYWIACDAPDASAGARRTRAGPDWRDGLVSLLIGALLAAMLFANRELPKVSGVPLHWPVVIVLGGLLVRHASTLLRLGRDSARNALGVARERNRLTRALRRWTLVTLALAAFGVLDLLSWKIYSVLAHTGGSQFSRWMFGGLGITGVLVAILRALAEPLQKLESAANASRFDWRSRLLNALGFALGLFLLLAWLTLVQWFVFAGPPWSPIDAWSEPLRALSVAAATLAWFLFTAPHADTANASSLHSFYRARLTRAWLSVGNPTRFASGRQRTDAGDGFAAVPPDERTGETALNDVHSVTDVVAGDDIALTQHRPETKGGPIHLINTCLNQTRDDNSDLYNADRKGCMMTVSARGFEWGRNCFHPVRDGEDVGTLGRWIAISGAAAAPGAGSYTSSGWAMTLFFLGVRLGYWLRKPPMASAARAQPRGFDAWRWRRLPKPRLLISEARARYGGLHQPWWYLSDGGHFENTAVYPLLRRRLDFIVLADCGADARFELGDIDNLVRKARIDFGAEIEFYTHEDAVLRFDLAGSDLTVLSPEQLATNTSARGVLLARIRYRDDGAGVSTGTLLVVKPNLHKALDADVLGYALRNAGFPQQATGDQFFDEAQWESYQHLGFDFGHELHDAWLSRLPGWTQPAANDATQLARLRRPTPAVPDADASKLPFWRRAVPAAALGTTLGIGASSTLLLAAWQVVDQLRKEKESVREGHVTTIINAELYLDAQKPVLPGTDVAAVPLALRTHASELLAIADSSMDRQAQFRYDTVVAAYARYCIGIDTTASATSPGGTLCGVPRWIATDVPPEYWRPTCRSTYARPLDLRACPGQVVERVVIAAPSSAPPVAVEMPPPVAQLPEVAMGPPVALAGEAAGSLPTIAACLRRGVTLYTQVYDEDTRQAIVARFNALHIEGEVQKRIPPVENVVRSAERRGAAPPSRWRKPTLLVHDPADRECAEAFLNEAGGRLFAAGVEVAIRPLPTSLKATPRVIELWVPSGSVAMPEP